MAVKIYDLKEAKTRIRHYCAKEDRCQQQVIDKLYSYGLSKAVIDHFLVELIQEKFVDEERYARSFASGKFKINKWGRRKIVFELKKKKVSAFCIQKGLEEINESDYLAAVEHLLLKKRSMIIKNTNPFIRKKKMINYVVGKGYEPELVWQAINNL